MTIKSYPNGEDAKGIFDWEGMTIKSYPNGEDATGIFDQASGFFHRTME